MIQKQVQLKNGAGLNSEASSRTSQCGVSLKKTEESMKRKVILYLGVSLDGYLADADGGVDWLEVYHPGGAEDDGYRAFFEGVDTILMGMKTYLQIVTELSPNNWPYRKKKSVVFTHRKMHSTEFVEFVSGDAADFVSQLRKQQGKDIWVCGGAELVSQLIQADAIDVYDITILPVLLGSGIPLFRQGNPLTELRLEQLKACGSSIRAIYTRRR